MISANRRNEIMATEKCKNAKCDHTNCKGNCEKVATETKSCDPANCPGRTIEPVVK
jgi:hypothetical protein